MTRDEFMVNARESARKILEGKENGIMNLVQQAWAEGKRNAEVETLKAAIDEALAKQDKDDEATDDTFVLYPMWVGWLKDMGVLNTRHTPTRDGEAIHWTIADKAFERIPAEIGKKLWPDLGGK